MIVDSSVLVAILQKAPEALRLSQAMALDPVCSVSAANWLEASMIMFARRGFMKFGKGIHPAGLNFGDCFAYALARDTGEPLLFKGDDFAKTDIPAVAY